MDHGPGLLEPFLHQICIYVRGWGAGGGPWIASIGCLILTQIRPLIRKKTCFLWFENVFTNNHLNMQTALCTVIGQQAGNITYIQLTERTVNFFKFQVDIDVKDIDHIRSIIAVLRLN